MKILWGLFGEFSLSVVVLICAATPSLADTIYNNLEPGNTWIINREYNVNNDFMATTFVASSDGKLADVLLPLFSLHNPVSMGLYTDSSANPERCWKAGP